MPRDINPALIAALCAPGARPFRAIEIMFPSMPLRLWTGVNNRVLQGNEYIGAGRILSFGDVEETGAIEASGTTVTLAGLDPAIMETALDEPYQGSLARMYLGERTVASSMVEIGTGTVDTMTIDNSPGQVTITIQIENILVDLLRPRVKYYTHEEQQLIDPDDMAFEFVTRIQDMQLLI